MNKKPIPLADSRTPVQQEADAQIVAGDWAGFEVTNLLSDEGADQIIEHCHNLAKEAEMDQTTTLGSIKSQPFRWKDKVYRILRYDYVGGQALVEAIPHDPDFVAELKKRVEADRFHTLTYYQGFGFISFPEDYAKYKD